MVDPARTLVQPTHLGGGRPYWAEPVQRSAKPPRCWSNPPLRRRKSPELWSNPCMKQTSSNFVRDLPNTSRHESARLLASSSNARFPKQSQRSSGIAPFRGKSHIAISGRPPFASRTHIFMFWVAARQTGPTDESSPKADASPMRSHPYHRRGRTLRRPTARRQAAHRRTGEWPSDSGRRLECGDFWPRPRRGGQTT